MNRHGNHPAPRAPHRTPGPPEPSEPSRPSEPFEPFESSVRPGLSGAAAPSGPSAPSRARASRARRGDQEARELLRVAQELADDLASDAVARDRDGKPPAEEAERIREAGLPGRLGPPCGPYGTDWRTGCAVVREIAAADSSLGELLARHHVLARSGRFFGTRHRATQLERTAASRQWLWAGELRTVTDGARPDDLTLTPDGSGYLLDGRRAVRAGAAVADQLLVDAVCTGSGDVLVVRVPRDRAGVAVEPVWERLGQRVAGAGTVDFERVALTPREVLGTAPDDEESTAPSTALASPVLRLALAHVALGTVEGALAEARDVSRGAAGTGAEGWAAGGDPDLLVAYGELAASAHTAAAVVERATDAAADALTAGAALGVDEQFDVAVQVCAAEEFTSRTALEATARVLELAEAPGLDRFWRNARTLTAHRRSAPGLRHIGGHYLRETGRPGLCATRRSP
ncbi:acyl-CoA dehydrogenase [Streptomyces cacaoi]|uniref:FMNH2-dependent monooxygenase n=2 Tax=Streptomyces cacaoi TaxID=1898 RepID=A0A4Y3QZ39_STRCI|nr:acyl-CoA dehydrogenase [Streptomyces cacaoi]GEB49853.1 FMNH2-dependent monooxygenase [Streptomyces cacaoi]